MGPHHITNCQTTGRGVCSGRLTAIAAHPTEADTYYVAAAGGGVWRTETGGKHWTPLTDEQPINFLGALAISRSNPNVLYAGTGEANHGPSKMRLNRENIYYGFGILRSADAGQSWELVGQEIFHRRTISKIVVHPTNPNLVFAAVGARGINGLAGNTGIWRSTNGGDSWTRIVSGITNLSANDAVSDLVMDPSNPNTLYAAVGTPAGGPANGVYKTTDQGESWAVAGNFPLGSADPRMGRITLEVAPSLGRVVHAAIAGSNQMGAGLGLLRHVRSFDSGVTWANLPNVPNYMSNAGDYMNVLAIDPRDPNIIYASGLGIVASRDGGLTWSDIGAGIDGQGPHVDHHAMAFDAAGRLLDGNDGGIWRLDNPLPGERRWANLNTDLATLQFIGVALHPTDPDRAYGGLQDNGTVRFQDSLIWPHFRDGDGGYARVTPDNPQIFFVTFQYTTGGQFLARTDNGGGSFQSRTDGISTSDPAKFYQPYLIDPSQPTRLLLGTNRVYETTNRGNRWNPISRPLADGWTVNAIIDAVAPAPGHPEITYASAGGRIFYTANYGLEWFESNPVPPQLGLRLTDIKVDPSDPGVVFVTTSSFNDLTGGGRVWFTHDYGTNWFDISGDLPDLPAWSLAVDWGTPDRGDEFLYLGTDAGVFTTNDFGASWPRLAKGLPNVQVHELELNQRLGILSAATHGRGLWQLEIPPRSRPGTPRLVVLDNVATLLGSQPGHLLRPEETAERGVSTRDVSEQAAKVQLLWVEPETAWEYREAVDVDPTPIQEGVWNDPVSLLVLQ